MMVSLCPEEQLLMILVMACDLHNMIVVEIILRKGHEDGRLKILHQVKTNILVLFLFFLNYFEFYLFILTLRKNLTLTEIFLPRWSVVS